MAYSEHWNPKNETMPRERLAEWPALEQRLATDLAQAYEGPRFITEQAPYGTPPRFELKAKRLVDARPVAQYS